MTIITGKSEMGLELKLPMVRIYYAIFVVLLPVFLLVINPFSALAEWQSGKWQDIWALWLSHKVHWIFWPMYVWAIAALVFLIKDFEVNSKKIWIRLGIYVGTFWCWMYLIFESILFLPSIFSGLISWENVGEWWQSVIVALEGFIIWLGWHFKERFNYKKSLGILSLVMLMVVALYSQSRFSSSVFSILLLVPPMATILATKLSIQIFRVKEVVSGWKSILAFWLYAGFSLAESIFRLIAEYNKLPKSPPHCFIVTAAATGHSIIVGEERTQLHNFEKFEVWLKLRHPYLQYRLRRVYNYAGPVIANVINKNRILADITYMALKPLEWVCKLAK